MIFFQKIYLNEFGTTFLCTLFLWRVLVRPMTLKALHSKRDSNVENDVAHGMYQFGQPPALKHFGGMKSISFVIDKSQALEKILQ